MSPDGDLAVAWHGHGWRTLAQAKRHIEQLVAGERQLSGEQLGARRGPLGRLHERGGALK